MCQQVLENWYCSDCNRSLGQQQWARNCAQARGRRAGNCSEGIIPHRGAPYTDSTKWCNACKARYEQSMVDRDNRSYQGGGNYTW
ncbi:hypothetical protein PG991_003554 [Apiospora marii]|uniref:Uncharacterized protein n=1 Tax=Apiospora marii TaxID=335849 RepID=A0ABR1S3R8_9PEZI